MTTEQAKDLCRAFMAGERSTLSAEALRTVFGEQPLYGPLLKAMFPNHDS